MGKRVLVTGAAGGQQGATGRQVAELLLSRGIAVRAFVRTLDDRAERLRNIGPGAIRQIGSITGYAEHPSFIRSKNADVPFIQSRQNARVRMVKQVLDPVRNESHRRMRLIEQVIGGRSLAAMMADLQYVDPWKGRKLPLDGLLHIACKQEPMSAILD